ncbi:hypothetical protein GCM10010978_16820 [Compostibacillus humi]|uniref:GyrI-like small molecule binding domain-containing protein n=1 Tax=Compostibacillus humi TaxID=1245525 RepID=A0A8J2TML3_9BACI|nr:GyrI-like domain-containing protein [Compostibacillus humi]GFZ75883.1 hypothetical protein GCM10010978_16820 [Compostibacillus humi]
MKHEWRKKEKDLYLPKEKPQLLTVPKQQFPMLEGKGDPNKAEFAERVGVLYSVAYAIRMMPKWGTAPEGYFEYTVYPLEGIWDLTEKGRKESTLNKDEFVYTIMIRQPEFVSDEIVELAMERVRKKNPHPYLEEVAFRSMEDGLSLQMLHVGPYDEEPKTFQIMDDFAEENHLRRTDLTHREIYLSDVRKVEPAKLKTVLRYKVEKIGE